MLGLLALQTGVLLLAVATIGGYGWDDGAITLAYSRTFAETGRVALTPASDQVEGFSSISWFLLNGLAAVARPSFERAILVSQLLAAATLVAGAAVMDRLARDLGLARGVRWALLGTFALLGPLFSETVNGMEMGLLTLSALVLVHRLYVRRHPAWVAAAVAVFVATRFEAAFYLAFLLAPLLAQRRPREFLTWAGWGAVVFVGIALVRWAAFQALFPNTIYAKMHAPYRVDAGAVGARLRAALEVLALFAPALVVLAARTAWARRVREVFAALRGDYALVAPILAGVVFALITGPNWGYVGRMQLFTIPFVLLLLGRWSALVAPASPPARLALGLALAALTVWSGRVGAPLPSYRLSRSHELGVTPAAFRETGRAVERVRLALGTPRITFATPDIGGAALCCPALRIVDLGLLTHARLARDGYAALGTVIGTERPEVIEVHTPWSDLSGLYELTAFRERYRPALIDRTRLYLRDDVAERLEADGFAEPFAIDESDADAPGIRATLASHRYAGFTSPEDDAAFGGTGSVLVVP